MNIVQLIMNQLGSGGVTEKLAGMLDLSADQAKSATGAAVPGLLAGLTSLASTPDGARKLDAAVDAIDDDVVANPDAALRRGAGDSGSGGGGGMLQSLLGGGMLSGLGTALSKFTGMGSGTVLSMLGGLAPMVLGMLKKQKQSLGLDASGLAGLLSSQKSNIMAAMPSGLSSALGSVPGLSSLTEAGRSASAAVTGAAGDAYARGREAVTDTYDRGRQAVGSASDRGREAVADPAYRAPEKTGASPWLWLLPLALLAGLIGWMLTRSPRQTPVATAPPPAARDAIPAPGEPAPVAVAPAPADTAPAPVAPAAPSNGITDAAQTAGATIAAQGADAATQFTDVTKKLTESLGSIRDTASAEAALPQLRELSQKLDGISSMRSSLPANAQSRLTGLADTSRTTLKAAADKAMAIPGVSDQLKPVIEQLMTKIDAIAGK